METSPLKSFAPSARTALINEVTARIAVVLAPGSSERVEQRSAVAALEKAIDAARGGDAGRVAVAEQVAYTWFNRIIALRFMDANGYTGVGVVSPQRGAEASQPEILADAKRGVFDPDVVSPKVHDSVLALLDGTRQSGDPQGEAYVLLLTEYCRHWHRAMPFMFERAGDFTELLVPANLLADDSVLNRAVAVMTAEVCTDVEIIGWLYQFYISERKEEVFAGFKKGKKAGADEIPAATQLFTPDWVVRYLVQNSVGRLWMLNRPNSRLVDQMDYYIVPVDEEADFLRISGPEELTVMDPACGSAHMLTYAFDLLYAIYEEEGYSPADIPTLILTKNLFGTEIDPRAGALASFALTMKARARQRSFFNRPVEPNLCVLEPISFTQFELDYLCSITSGSDLTRADAHTFWTAFEHADVFGSLIRPIEVFTAPLRNSLARAQSDDLLASQALAKSHRVLEQADYLIQTYTVTIANPPYMGNGGMGTLLAQFAKNEYATSKSDLFAMFIERCVLMTKPFGSVAMITMHSWMFLSSYEVLRRELMRRAPIKTMAHLGERAFDSIGGAVVATTAFTLVVGGNAAKSGFFIRAVDGGSESAKSALLKDGIGARKPKVAFLASAESFNAIPGSPISYWLSPAVRSAFALADPLRSLAAVRKGMVTTDNDRFVRQWYEVSWGRCGFKMTREVAKESGRTWFPQSKGGSFRKWYGNLESVVNWEDDGATLKNHVVSRYGGGSYTKEIRSEEFYFEEGLSWSAVSSGEFGVRLLPAGCLFNNASAVAFTHQPEQLAPVLALLNSSTCQVLLGALAPTLNFVPGTVAEVPIPHLTSSKVAARVSSLLATARADWDSFETSWDFAALSLVPCAESPLSQQYKAWSEQWKISSEQQQYLETENNREVAQRFGLEREVPLDVPLHRVSLSRNVEFTYGPQKSAEEYAILECADLMQEIVSYAVGCMFGRYSLDEPGLVLADQGATQQEYLAKVPTATFKPDADNVIPIVDGDWFEDDIVARFRQFLRVAFGERHFEENLRFVTESLGVKDLRDYFVKTFYKDHVQRYKKRPIYWLFSSPKGSFNALIYMHRYTSSTVSTVLNEYLREYKAKLTASFENQERLAAGGGTAREQAAAQKEADRLRKVLLELDEYEHNVLYPLASQQIEIDLDDGVKTNYPKFGAALKKIPGLEAPE